MRTFEGISIPDGDHWTNLFAHFLALDDHKKMPGATWNKKAKELIDRIGHDEFVDTGVSWILKCIEKSEINQNNIRLGLARSHEKISESLIGSRQDIPQWLINVYGTPSSVGDFFPAKAIVMNNSSNYFYYSFGGRILRGFIHCSVVTDSRELLQLVDRFAAANPNECADALHVYTQLPVDEGVPRITRIRARIKKKNIQTRVETALKKIGEKMKLTPDQVEEISVSDYDLDPDHVLRKQMADYTAEYRMESLKKTSLVWIHNGKEQSTVPAKVKSDFPQELKDLKASIKDIEGQLSAQKDRIEGFYLKKRSWSYREWFPLYISHPLIGVLGKQLIWDFESPEGNIQGIWKEDNFVDISGKPLAWIGEGTPVKLWHPVESDTNDILLWRTFLKDREIAQPFKQAFREVYILTDAEVQTHSYSNRFAGHILDRGHFSGLCKARNWTPSAMATGQPTRRVPDWKISVEFWVDEIWLGESSPFHGSAHITTDQVRFYRDKQQLNMADVPVVIFSELMRDIDLFVGVTSIANDPGWQDHGAERGRNYWEHYAFGDLSESSKMRRLLLENLVPRLKIAGKCSFDGKFLKVEGKLRTYKIHIGSGNILMEPNDQYLCIVPDSSKAKPAEKIYLPFEGDNMLSIIISKAFLLADDDRITDPTITQQINR